MAAPDTQADGGADGARRWHFLALIFVCRVGLGFQFQTLGSVSDALVAELGFRYTEIGTLIGLFMLPGLLLALPAGYAGRHFRDRTLAALGLGALALGGALAALAQGFGLLALGRLAAGAGLVFSTVYFTKMVTDWFAGRELATAMSVLVMSWPFGIAMGQVGHAWIATVFDWRIAFVVASAYCAASALAIAALYRAPPGLKAAAPAAVAVGLPREEWILTLLAALVWGLFNAGYIVFLSFAPRLLVAQGHGPTEAAGIISLASWVMIFSGAACGYVADRTGRRDLILYLCLSIGTLAVLLLKFAPLALAASLALGLFGAAPAGIVIALSGEAMAPQRRAFGMGVFFSGYFVMVTVTPPIAGWMFDASGDPFLPIVFAAGLLVATMAAHRVFRVVRRRMPVRASA